jgi:hypothetical protein
MDIFKRYRDGNMYNNVRFEIYTAVTMKNAVLWDVAPCRSCVNRLFGGTYRLHFLGRKICDRGISVSRINTQTPVPQVGFEPTILVFERAKTVRGHYDRRNSSLAKRNKVISKAEICVEFNNFKL